jgi:copper chaperone CopZ
MPKPGSLPSLTLLLLVLVGLSHVQAGNREDDRREDQTRITVEDMHCADCAKKIARKLYLVKGVKGVRADAKKNTALVTPEKEKQPSPRALWKAIEEAGFKPVKLVGPQGEFEDPPKE